MSSSQRQEDHLKEISRMGLSTEQANVELVRMQRVRVIVGRMPAQVRAALNAAVKRGELGHFKKENKKPEAYYHPNFRYLAVEQRASRERKVLEALAGVCG